MYPAPVTTPPSMLYCLLLSGFWGGWLVMQRKAKGPELGSLLWRTQLRDVFKKPEYKMIRKTTDLKAVYA